MGLLLAVNVGYLYRNWLGVVNVCFSRKRSFKLCEIQRNEGQLTAEAASKETSDGQSAGSAKVCGIF